MSKGKGAAKGAPVAPVAENPDGAKFATVRAGTAEHPLSMLINLNCPVDIILDNVKRLLVKRIDAMIQDIKDAQAAEPVPPSAEEGEGQPEADTAPAPSPSEEAVSKLQDIKNKLTNPVYAIELIDKSGASANCKENLKKLACEGVLAHNSVYNVASVDVEGAVTSCFLDSTVAEPPKSPTKKK